jgi:hypothetical protein
MGLLIDKLDCTYLLKNITNYEMNNKAVKGIYMEKCSYERLQCNII